jgi:hypothetical protein
MTSDPYLWAVKPFAYLFNIYWGRSQNVVVAGYSAPQYDLIPGTDNFQFCQIDAINYDADHWSDGLLRFLHAKEISDQELFILLLEDYWLVRQVDIQAIEMLSEYMENHVDILRMDLTTDRLYAGGMFDVDYWGRLDIVETPYETPYQTSLQAGIWRKSLMLKILDYNYSPWRFEIDTKPPEEMRVCGTRQSPIRYANIFKGGKILQSELDKIPTEYRERVMNMIPTELREEIVDDVSYIDTN